MANQTDPFAKNVHGTNPQYIVDRILRQRIYNHIFWKEHCFGLNAETLVEKAMNLLEGIGGTYGGNRKPSRFLCFALKLLQIQPERDIILEYIKNEDFKYIRALGAFYMRLVGTPLDVYQLLEPLYNDKRKLRFKGLDGKYTIIHMDEFADQLLRNDVVCDVTLPFLTKRSVYEQSGELEPWRSILEDELDEEEAAAAAKEAAEAEKRKEEEAKQKQAPKQIEPSSSSSSSARRERDDRSDKRDDGRRSRSRSRSRSPSHRKSSHSSSSRYRDDDYDDDRHNSRRKRSRSRSSSRDRDRYRDRRDIDRYSSSYKSRSRSRSPDDRRRDRDSRRDYHSSSSSSASKRSRDEPPARSSGAKSGDSSSMSIEETNKMRASLGLAPLKM